MQKFNDFYKVYQNVHWKGAKKPDVSLFASGL